VAYTSEIDKLEARFRENPKGRNFAPLADAYRKAGLIDNAVELCQSGLKLHPDYVSAHIVYGRCLIDKKDDAGATDVFSKVLSLDPENIIALRVLSEIAERNGRFDQAVEWLTRLLAADPMNGDAAEALGRAKGKAASAKLTIADAPTAAMPRPEFVVEHTSLTADATPTASAARPSPDVETFDGTLNVNPAAHAAAKAEGLEVQEDVELNSQQIERVDVEGLARTQYDGSGMFKLDGPPPPEPPEAADDASPHVDLPLIMPDDKSPRRTPPPRTAPLRPPPVPGPPPRVPAAVTLSDDDGAADAATLAQAEPVLTETMAELYLKQGHQQDALRVYQALLAQRPGDARLRARIEQISSGGRRGGGGGGGLGRVGASVPERHSGGPRGAAPSPGARAGAGSTAGGSDHARRGVRSGGPAARRALPSCHGPHLPRLGFRGRWERRRRRRGQRGQRGRGRGRGRRPRGDRWLLVRRFLWRLRTRGRAGRRERRGGGRADAGPRVEREPGPARRRRRG
jgi:tetratricopeptide (TPR) repeat protein